MQGVLELVQRVMELVQWKNIPIPRAFGTTLVSLLSQALEGLGLTAFAQAKNYIYFGRIQIGQDVISNEQASLSVAQASLATAQAPC